MAELKSLLPTWAKEFGFADIGVTDLVLDDYLEHFESWLENGYQGEMSWMSERRGLRAQPHELVPNTVRVLSLRMNYLRPDTEPLEVLNNSSRAYISRYALGRDYHKLIRKRLANLASQIHDWANDNDIHQNDSQRVFVDSAPVLEKPFAEKAGMGWIGKNTLLLNKEEGSWFFLGEIFTNLDIPVDRDDYGDHCNNCRACLKVCPTDAFPKPYVLDARKCISYLTIEHKGAIPVELRSAMGNRVFGCDDCQLICPWNRYAKSTSEGDFSPRHGLESSELVSLFNWDEETFLAKTAGSPIRRAGYQNWRRNLSVGIGNGPSSPHAISALANTIDDSPIVQEHVNWALENLTGDRAS